MGQTEAGGGAAYCRGCDYSLRGLSSQGKCPECGRTFDRSDVRTYRLRPRRPLWRLLRWPAYGLLALTLLSAAGVGWLYWDWRREQPAIEWVRGQGSVDTRMIGPTWLQVRAGRWAWLLARADEAVVAADSPTAGQERVLGRLTRLKKLWLLEAGVTDEWLGVVAELTELEEADLWETQVTDVGLARLAGHPGLTDLHLTGAMVTSAGLAHLRRLPRLKVLSLHETGVDDSTVPILASLTGLELLDVQRTKLTPVGMDRLDQALPNTMVFTDSLPAGPRPTTTDSDGP